MIKTKRLLLLVFSLVLLTSCRTSTGSLTLEPTLSTQTATFPAAPATTTAQQPTETPTTGPTEKLSPTDTILPPTFTPEPFLPQGLPLIEPENIVDLKTINVIPVKEIYALAFSQSGNKLATISERWQDRSRFIEVWDLVSGEQILFLDNLGTPWDPFFSPDETQLFVFNPNQGIDIYDLAQKKLVRTMEINADGSAFSPDGKYIAIGDYLGTPDESTIKVIDLATEQEQFTLTGQGMVMHIEFSPDGSLLVGGFQVSNHFRNFVWDISTLERVADLIDYDYGLTFSPDNRMAATVKRGKVSIFSTEGWVLGFSYGFKDPNRQVKPRAFTQDKQMLAAEDRYNIVFLETKTGEELFALPGECDLRFSPKGNTLITWCYQSEVKIWGVIP